MRKLPILLTLLAVITAAVAQTLTNPVVVKKQAIITWTNPNDPLLCAWSSIYAVPAGGGTIRKTSPTPTLTNANVGVLMGTAPNGIYYIYQTYTDRDGVEGFASTNFYIYFWDGGRLKPGQGLGVR